MRRSAFLFSAIWAVTAALAGCGDDPPTVVDPDDPLLQPFVGTWEADSLVVTSTGDSIIVADVIARGGTLTWNVQPSGAFTLTLVYAGSPLVVIGQAQAFETAIVTTPTVGPPESYAYEFLAADRLVLEGGIVFPFTSGAPTPGELYTEMVRR